MSSIPSVPSLPAVPSPANRRQRVQSAETGMAVLKGLARLGGRTSLTALAAHVGESPAKVHRYLASLVEAGLVAQDGNSHYHLDTEAIHIGLAALRQADPIRLAEDSLVRLREHLEVTCFVAVMGNKGPTIVRFEEPGLPVTVNVRVGSVLSLVWSASGRVFLGMLDERGVRDMALAEIADASPAMRARLPADDPVGTLQREVNAAGCAIVRDVYLPGISAVSAPIRDAADRVCAVITALGASGGFDTAGDGPIARAVRREAHETSLRLGYSTDQTTA